jgi:hypothetical protein
MVTDSPTLGEEDELLEELELELVPVEEAVVLLEEAAELADEEDASESAPCPVQAQRQAIASPKTK